MADNQIGRLRLLAQRVAPAAKSGPVQIAEWLTCMQAQDFGSARSAVALRAGCTVEDVDIAINAGALVRSWPMRGTLHLVPAAQLRWMLRINAGPTLRSVRRRHQQLGIETKDIDRAQTVATEQLTGGRGLDRTALFAAWERHGIATGGQRGVHLVQTLCLREHLVLGPITGKLQQFVLFDEWIPVSDPVDHTANVADWARRYFRSHGPATLADFKWWSGLLQRDIAPVWDEVRTDLTELISDDTTYFLAPDTLERWAANRAATLRPVLTPAFDEVLLGYADRTATVDRRHLDLVVPGGNGVFRGVLLDGGRGVATWKRNPAKSVPDIAISPFGAALGSRAERALPRLIRSYPFA